MKRSFHPKPNTQTYWSFPYNSSIPVERFDKIRFSTLHYLDDKHLCSPQIWNQNNRMYHGMEFKWTRNRQVFREYDSRSYDVSKGYGPAMQCKWVNWPDNDTPQHINSFSWARFDERGKTQFGIHHRLESFVPRKLPDKVSTGMPFCGYTRLSWIQMRGLHKFLSSR